MTKSGPWVGSLGINTKDGVLWMDAPNDLGSYSPLNLLNCFYEEQALPPPIEPFPIGQRELHQDALPLPFLVIRPVIMI